MDPFFFHSYSKPAVPLSSDSESDEDVEVSLEKASQRFATIFVKGSRIAKDEAPFHDFEVYVDVIQSLEEVIEKVKDREVLPDPVYELVMKRRLNIMLLDLYSYVKGFELSFLKFGSEEELFHGAFSYGVGLIDYIKDGEIPFELFDCLYQYEFQLIYDGYIVCQVRIHFNDTENMQSHFVLLRHSIQTIDAECALNCEADPELNFDSERARLIMKNSKDLCLDPDLTVTDFIEDSILNEYPFLSPELKHFIYNKKADIEEGLKKFEGYPKFKEAPAGSSERNRKNWTYKEPGPPFEGFSKETSKEKVASFAGTSKEMSKEQVDSREGTSKDINKEIAELVEKFRTCYLLNWSELKVPTSPIASHLIGRKIYLPGLEHFHYSDKVEIENFVFECTTRSNIGNLITVCKKLSISVTNSDGYFYGAYQHDNKEKVYWLPLGRRKELDLYIDNIAKENVKYNKGELKITHKRFFGDRVSICRGRMKRFAEKLEHPLSKVVLHLPASEEGENEELEMETDNS